MNRLISGAAVAAGLIAAPVAHAQEAISTKPQLSVETQLKAQQEMIERQAAQIRALQDQLNDVTAIISNRVDRTEAATENGRVSLANPGPRFEGPNARHSMNIIGAVQVGVGLVDEKTNGSAAPILHGGTEIKRARIGLQGTAFSDYAYAVEFDLAANGTVSSAARDLWVQYNGFRPLSLTLGNQKPQTGLEASFSDRSNAATLIEPSIMTSMITAQSTRALGLRASTGGSHWSSSLGIYGDDVNNNGVAVPFKEGMGVHGRFTYAPIVKSNALLHLGVSGYWRDIGTGRATGAADPLGAQLRVRAQPESSIDAARLIDTGNLAFADAATLIGLEAAGFVGPVGFQSEWSQMNVTELAGRPDLTFSGAYFTANWFLTGERRVYDARTGVFTRVAPRVNLDPSSGKWGAWEVAARWSTLDLNSDPNLATGTTLLGVRGGEQTDYTLGVNWYWNPYFRMMLNYIHADADNRTNSLPGIGADESATANLVSLRVQQEW